MSTLASAAFTAAYHHLCDEEVEEVEETNEDSAEDTVEVDVETLARELEKSGERDMAIRLRRSSWPPRPAN